MPPEPHADSWTTLRDKLAQSIRGLEVNDYLIITHEPTGQYIQFVGQRYGVRAEAQSNEMRDIGLTKKNCKELENLGWNPPNSKVSHGSPNFYLDAALPVPYEDLAALTIDSFREVYGVEHAWELVYKAFDKKQRILRFPLLSLRCEVE